MKSIGVGIEENVFVNFGNFIIYLMLFEVWFEVGDALGRTLAMGSCKDVLMILPDFLREFAPSSFNCWG